MIVLECKFADGISRKVAEGTKQVDSERYPEKKVSVTNEKSVDGWRKIGTTRKI